MMKKITTDLSSTSLLWITDPWDTLSHTNDTTLRLMNESFKMGIQTFWSASDFIFKSKLNALVRPWVGMATGLASEANLEMELSKFRHIHYRIDPPVDTIYISLLDQLLERGALETQILNPPLLLKFQSEKLSPPELFRHSPLLKTIEQAEDSQIAANLFQHHSWIVTKPLNTAQSKGVKKFALPQSESDWLRLCQTETENFTRAIVVEEYLSEIDQGETRIWFANGQIIAALKKFPKTGDFRVLIDEGSRVEAHTLNSEEKNIAEEIGATLKKQGAGLAAIDLIGKKISDYNITSPGLLTQLEMVHQKNFAKTILENLLG